MIARCHGIFNLVHVGHIRYLQKAKALGDTFVVTLAPAPYVKRGPHRPVPREELRADALGCIACVGLWLLSEFS